MGAFNQHWSRRPGPGQGAALLKAMMTLHRRPAGPRRFPCAGAPPAASRRVPR